jgi:hypothetical protein
MMQAKAESIIAMILEDMLERGNLNDAWDNIDEDTQQEILETWVAIAHEQMNNTASEFNALRQRLEELEQGNAAQGNGGSEMTGYSKYHCPDGDGHPFCGGEVFPVPDTDEEVRNAN